MLRAVGFTDEDFKKPMIGVASTWSEVTPCNMHIDKLALEAKQGYATMAAPLILTRSRFRMAFRWDMAVCCSPASREAIADSVEIVTGAERFDGLVAIGGCDKNTPACLMAIGRMNIPAVYVYGVPSNPGNSKARTWISLRLLKRSGNITMEKCQTSDSIRLSARLPGPGSCGGMYSQYDGRAAEAMGMSLPGSSSTPAISPDKAAECAAWKAGHIAGT